MKTLFTLVLACSMASVFAQTSKPAQTSPAPAAQQPAMSAKAKSLCKEWKFTGSESFDLPQPPTEIQKGDLLNLMESGRYRLIYEGVAEGGTWTVDAAGKWITLTSDAGTVKKYQVLSQTEKELKVDYRDADGTHNVLIYQITPAPAPAGQKR